MNRYSYTKSGTLSKLERMKEIYRMWLLISFLRKHRIDLAFKLNDQKADAECKDLLLKEAEEITLKDFEITGEKPTAKRVRKTLDSLESKYDNKFANFLASYNINSYYKEALVSRKDLIELYISVKYTNINEVRLKNKKVELNSIIQSCIDKNEPLIKQCDEKGEEISLTFAGKQFAAIDGLLKAEIKEFGVLSSIVITAIAVGFPWIIKISSYISPWW